MAGTRPRRSARVFACLCAVLLTLTAAAARAQTVEHTENKADQALRSEARVDPSTFGMGLQVPLGGLPGRAGMSLPVGLSYSSKVWRINYSSSHTANGPYSWSFAQYAEHSASGWTTTLDVPRVEYTGQGQLYSAEGIPQGDDIDDASFAPRYYLTLIDVHLPDGSSHKLRKDYVVRQFNGSYDYSGVFHAVDGSRVRYDYDNRTLHLPDGSRYVLGDPTGYNERRGDPTQPTYYVDRNGNTHTYTFDHTTGVRQWTDTLGRSVALPIPKNVAGSYVYSLPRAGGGTADYTFRWKSLSEPGVLTDAGQSPRYTGSHKCMGATYTPMPAYLFNRSYHDYVCSSWSVFDPVVLSEIELPTGEKYRFTYNVYGEIDKVYYPTGGYERFRHAAVPAVSETAAPYGQANRGVVERWVSASGGGGDEAHWEYGATTGSFYSPPYTAYTVAPGGARQERVLQMGGGASNFGLDDARTGMAHEERAYSAPDQNGNRQLLRRSLTEWSVSTVTVTSEQGHTLAFATKDPRVTREVALTLDTGGQALAATTTYGHDQDLNVTSTARRDYASVDQATAQTGAITSIPQGALVRTDEVTYLVNDSSIPQATRNDYRARGLSGLPTSTRVKNADGAIVAQSEMRYDEAGYAPLECGAAVGWADPQTNVRGMATTARSWLDTSNTWVETHTRYDACGSARKAWDARGQVSEVEYSAQHHYAYPTTTRTAVPDPTNQQGSNTALVTTTDYHTPTGRVTSTTDANNRTTELSYTDEAGAPDPLGRLRKVTRPDGGWTSYAYGRNAYGDYVRTQTKLNTAGVLTDAYQWFDGLGRPKRSFSYDPQVPAQAWQTADTEYDPLGRAWRASLPYRSAGAATAVNPSGRWAETTFDDLGRVVRVKTTADGASVETAYAGQYVTVTDQAGRVRRSKTDALGRLVRVDEPDAAGGLGAADAPAQPTHYTYDALGNLRKVDQGGQQRFFMYDSLGRLIRARNPEQGTNPGLAGADPVTGNSQWSAGYVYDPNGNLVTKSEPRAVSIWYAYDNLNRVTAVDYTDTSQNPDVERFYDGATLGKGRLWKSRANGASGTLVTVPEYDDMGRPLSQTQQFYTGSNWGAAFSVGRTYDLAGNVTTQTYPSQRTVSYTYDGAGRLATFSGNLGDGTPRTYSSDARYHELGGMEQERFGTTTPVYNKSLYNSRGQLSEIRVSTYGILSAGQETNWNRGAIINHYSLQSWAGSGTDNNGNLRKQDVYIPTDDAISGSSLTTQFYDYDSLNRLDAVREERGATQWRQDYAYDRWGNRTIDAAGTWLGSPSAPPSELIPEKQFAVNPNTNRLGVPAGQPGAMTYDDAGNLTFDSYSNFAGGGSRAFDAEGRMTAAQYFDGQVRTAAYTYDADGRRVRRQNGLGAETWQVYGLDGELLAEYAAQAQPAAPQKEYGYRAGSLLVTAEAGAPAPAPESAVVWTSAVGVSASGNSLTKPGGVAAWDAGAVSTRALASGDGHVEFTAAETNKNRMCGLSSGDAGQDYTDIDFAIYLYSDATVYVSEGGVIHGPFGTYAAGDQFRVAVEGGVVRYRRNGSLLYTSTAAPQYPLLVDTALSMPGATINNVTLSGELVQNVAWVNAVGVTATGNSLVRGGAPVGWTAGAASEQSITAGDGYVEFTATETNANRMCGLSNGDSNQDYTDIDFALYLYSDGTVYVFEGGVNRGSFGPYAAGDRLRVGVEGGVVKYRRNGSLLYTSQVQAQYPLLADSSLSMPGATVTGAVMGGGAAASSGGGGGVQWMVSDQLGTPRVVIDQTGGLSGVRRHDYLPFGEEIQEGVGGRTTNQGYVGDNLRHRYTTYERDAETGLDYAKARYYASVQGRFTSVDPAMGSAKPGAPQTWNRYTYGLNNPLLYIDPTGMVWAYATSKDGKTRSYTWYGDPKDVPTGSTVLKNPEDFYVEGEVNGEQRGIYFNPDGPYSTVRNVLDAFTATKFLSSTEDYYRQGYQVVPTRESLRFRSQMGVVYPDYATQFALTGAGALAASRTAAFFSTRGISTPYGSAVQSTAPEALAAREAVEGGALLYRGGVLGRSAGPEGQFWSLESPLSAGYAQRYGLPSGNSGFNFIEYGTLKPGHPFITRPAPGLGANAGGGIEAVVKPGSVRLRGFTQP